MLHDLHNGLNWEIILCASRMVCISTHFYRVEVLQIKQNPHLIEF